MPLGEQGHLWPQVLPDGRSVLFTIWSAAPEWDDARIAVADLDSGDHRVVLERGAYGRYTASGHLVFWRADDLWAVQFDIDRLETIGEPVRVVENVRFDPRIGQGHFDISENGTLAYVSGGLDYFTQTLIVDRSGTTRVPAERFGPSGDVMFSADGRRVAMTLQQSGAFHIGVYDLERDLPTQLTTQDDNLLPTWMQDPNQLTYMSSAGGPYGFFTRAADGTGTATSVLGGEPENCCSAAAWSPDGMTALYSASTVNGREIRASRIDVEDSPIVLSEPGSQAEPSWSPDGRHFAYQSQQPGESNPEVYIRPFPDVDGGRVQPSLSGGWWPVWNEDGSIIYFASDEGIMAVDFEAGSDPSEMSVGQPALVLAITGVEDFDVSPDEETFVITHAPIETFATDINVVLNWFEELNELVPVQ